MDTILRVARACGQCPLPQNPADGQAPGANPPSSAPLSMNRKSHDLASERGAKRKFECAGFDPKPHVQVPNGQCIRRDLEGNGPSSPGRRWIRWKPLSSSTARVTELTSWWMSSRRSVDSAPCGVTSGRGHRGAVRRYTGSRRRGFS